MPRKKNRVQSATAHLKQITKHWSAIAKLVEGATEKQREKIDAMWIAWTEARGLTLSSLCEHYMSLYFDIRNAELEALLAVKESPVGKRRKLLLEMTKKPTDGGKRMQLKDAVRALRTTHPELMKGVTERSTLRNDMSEPDPDVCELIKQVRACSDDNDDIPPPNLPGLVKHFLDHWDIPEA